MMRGNALWPLMPMLMALLLVAGIGGRQATAGPPEPAAVSAALPPEADPPAAPALQAEPLPAESEAANPAAAEGLPAPAPLSRLAPVPAGEAGALIRAGRRLAGETRAVLEEAARRDGGQYTGNPLACGSCHREEGTGEGFLSWRGVAAGYPRYHPREGRLIELSDQVNACLQRNLGAAPLEAGSAQMQAILAWLAFLAPYPAPETALEWPDRRADLPAGEEVFRRACRQCHADDGGRARDDLAPMLWGPDSYTTGSDLNRLPVAARFLLDQMPPGAIPGSPLLSAEEAWDTAAYINSFIRPEFPGLENDYPLLSEKPADCPSPPFPDHFPADQHRYGPFAPIRIEAEAARLSDWRRYRETLAGYRLAEPLTARQP